jgi:hypothetical protein
LKVEYTERQRAVILSQTHTALHSDTNGSKGGIIYSYGLKYQYEMLLIEGILNGNIGRKHELKKSIEKTVT